MPRQIRLRLSFTVPPLLLLILVIGLVDGHPLPVDLELVGGDLLHVVICRLGRHGLELHLERVLGLKSVPHLQELTGRPGTLIWASWLCWLLSPSIPILDLLTVLGFPSSLVGILENPISPLGTLTVCRALLSE